MSMKLGVGSHDHILVRICGSWPNMISFAWCSLIKVAENVPALFRVDQLLGHANVISLDMRFASASARASTSANDGACVCACGECPRSFSCGRRKGGGSVFQF